MPTIRNYIKAQFIAQGFAVKSIRFTEDEEIFVSTNEGKFEMQAGSDDDFFIFTEKHSNHIVRFVVVEFED